MPVNFKLVPTLIAVAENEPRNAIKGPICPWLAAELSPKELLKANWKVEVSSFVTVTVSPCVKLPDTFSMCK